MAGEAEGVIVVPGRAHLHVILHLHRRLVEQEQALHLGHDAGHVTIDRRGGQPPHLVSQHFRVGAPTPFEGSREHPIQREVIRVDVREEGREDQARLQLVERRAQPVHELRPEREGMIVFAPEDGAMESRRPRDRAGFVEPDGPARLGGLVHEGRRSRAVGGVQYRDQRTGAREAQECSAAADDLVVGMG